MLQRSKQTKCSYLCAFISAAHIFEMRRENHSKLILNMFVVMMGVYLMFLVSKISTNFHFNAFSRFFFHFIFFLYFFVSVLFLRFVFISGNFKRWAQYKHIYFIRGNFLCFIWFRWSARLFFRCARPLYFHKIRQLVTQFQLDAQSNSNELVNVNFYNYTLNELVCARLFAQRTRSVEKGRKRQ